MAKTIKRSNRTRVREFSNNTKLLLAQRVAYMCCNPICRTLTIKPHETRNAVVILGEAGHINGVSVKGPRYNSKLTDNYIKSFTNGIWLCRKCHKLVDAEKSKYTDDNLRKWKNDTEEYASGLVLQETRLRQLRIISLETLSHLRILSALPYNLDKTFTDPRGNNIGLSRILRELELILIDNEFIQEADLIQYIYNDLENIIIPHVQGSTYPNRKDISEWKNHAVNRYMNEIMRYKDEAYQRYYKNEQAMVINAIQHSRSKNEIISKLDVEGSMICKN